MVHCHVRITASQPTVFLSGLLKPKVQWKENKPGWRAIYNYQISNVLRGFFCHDFIWKKFDNLAIFFIRTIWGNRANSFQVQWFWTWPAYLKLNLRATYPVWAEHLARHFYFSGEATVVHHPENWRRAACFFYRVLHAECLWTVISSSSPAFHFSLSVYFCTIHIPTWKLHPQQVPHSLQTCGPAVTASVVITIKYTC